MLPGSRLEERVLAQASGGELRSYLCGLSLVRRLGAATTMISLEGLTLSTGKATARPAPSLTTFSHYVKDGLLPAESPEGQRQALYPHSGRDPLVLPCNLTLRGPDDG